MRVSRGRPAAALACWRVSFVCRTSHSHLAVLPLDPRRNRWKVIHSLFSHYVALRERSERSGSPAKSQDETWRSWFERYVKGLHESRGGEDPEPVELDPGSEFFDPQLNRLRIAVGKLEASNVPELALAELYEYDRGTSQAERVYPQTCRSGTSITQSNA